MSRLVTATVLILGLLALVLLVVAPPPASLRVAARALQATEVVTPTLTLTPTLTAAPTGTPDVLGTATALVGTLTAMAPPPSDTPTLTPIPSDTPTEAPTATATANLPATVEVMQTQIAAIVDHCCPPVMTQPPCPTPVHWCKSWWPILVQGRK
jgi:hypothetical protein